MTCLEIYGDILVETPGGGGTAGRNRVNLSWALDEEFNFDYFALERSADSANFIEIARIDGAGNSSARIDYSYVDQFPLDAFNYSRLKSIDFDD